MSTRNLDIENFDKRYNERVVPFMENEFLIRNNMAVPRMEKIVLNAGVGTIGANDKKKLESIKSDMTLIAGQAPVFVKSKRAIAGFNVKLGSVVGIRVTLRGKKMKEFFNRLCMIGLPRIRDFQGIAKKSFDEMGNLSYGIREHIIFPEIKPEESLVNFGLQVNFATSAKNSENAAILLAQMGLPIKSKDEDN